MEQTRLYDLIRRYADDKATPEEILELHEWYRTVDTAATVEWPAEDPAEKDQLQQRIRARLGIVADEGRKGKVRQMMRVGWRVAACLILLAGAWMAWRYWGNRGPGEIAIYNPSGKILEVSLPDSSHVWLNAASTLRYAKAFSGHRELYLEGEGYFDVAEDAAHPFVVHSGALTTTVLGTSFDVRSFSTDSNATVTVVRGKVQVENAGKVLDQLTPARQLQWNERNGQVRTVSVDTAHTLAWQHGQLQFAGEDLREITATLGRWYGMKFILKNEALRSCELYAAFDNTISIQQALTVLSNVIDIQWTIDEKNRIVTLSGKGCQ